MNDQRIEQTLHGWWSLFSGIWWSPVGGGAEEWLAAADALESGEPVTFRRLAWCPEAREMWSPRNSVGQGDHVWIDCPERLAAQIREEIGAWVFQHAFGECEDCWEEEGES